MMAAVNMTHVPYRGAAGALTDLLSGEVQVMITAAADPSTSEDGKLRALAVTSATALAIFSQNLPTVAEILAGL